MLGITPLSDDDLNNSFLFPFENHPLTQSSRLTICFISDSEEEQYETHYACEDSRLNISCASGLHLNIIRANYGRFSIAICNAHGNTEWSVNCMSPRTLRVIRARCQGGSECQVPVDSTIFGDPCPGTFKYIEVHYSCDHGESSYICCVWVRLRLRKFKDLCAGKFEHQRKHYKQSWRGATLFKFTVT